MAAGLEVLGRSGRGGGNREQPVPGPDGRARRAARAATDATRRWARRAGGVPNGEGTATGARRPSSWRRGPRLAACLGQAPLASCAAC